MGGGVLGGGVKIWLIRAFKIHLFVETSNQSCNFFYLWNWQKNVKNAIFKNMEKKNCFDYFLQMQQTNRDQLTIVAWYTCHEGTTVSWPLLVHCTLSKLLNQFASIYSRWHSQCPSSFKDSAYLLKPIRQSNISKNVFNEDIPPVSYLLMMLFVVQSRLLQDCQKAMLGLSSLIDPV